jgi:hypothetical protein
MQCHKGRTAGIDIKMFRWNDSESTTPNSDLTLKLPRSEYPVSENKAAADVIPGLRQVLEIPSARQPFSIIVETSVPRVLDGL